MYHIGSRFIGLYRPRSVVNRLGWFEEGSLSAHDFSCQYPWARNVKGRRAHSTKRFRSLRILFCGSDDFSSASLRALNDLKQRNGQLISSIDVLCRPGKRYGRNLRGIREVPIKAVAKELGFTIHERDTFTGWQLPNPQGQPINLIIAVSFGLFIPRRILESTEYGGVNIHPSLLPDFRGPAPLQHILLAGETVTGVTLQSLDDKCFDHGIILAQTKPPFLAIPHPDRCNYLELLNFITPQAASLLVEGIENGVFVPPLVKVSGPKPALLRHAPKITSVDKQINWRCWCSSIIDRRRRALGRLWTNIWVDANEVRRFLFEDIEIVAIPDALTKIGVTETNPAIRTWDAVPDVQFLFYSESGLAEKIKWPYVDDGEAIIIATRDGNAVRVKEITVEGCSRRPARTIMQESRVHQGR